MPPFSAGASAAPASLAGLKMQSEHAPKFIFYPLWLTTARVSATL